MSQTTSNSAGSAVEAQSGPEVADRPMFYAAEAMEFLSDVQYRLGDQLADLAVQKVREEGRTLVTRDDIKATIERFGATLLKESAGNVGP